MSKTEELDRIIDAALLEYLREGAEIPADDVVDATRREIGPEHEAELMALGALKLREMIRASARRSQDPVLIDARLYEKDVPAIIPINGEFKPITAMTQDDFAFKIAWLTKQRDGRDRHVRALRRMERKLRRVWGRNPEWTVEVAQGFLDPEAA